VVVDVTDQMVVQEPLPGEAKEETAPYLISGTNTKSSETNGNFLLATAS
jgi:hypothetical protein